MEKFVALLVKEHDLTEKTLSRLQLTSPAQRVAALGHIIEEELIAPAQKSASQSFPQ